MQKKNSLATQKKKNSLATQKKKKKFTRQRKKKKKFTRHVKKKKNSLTTQKKKKNSLSQTRLAKLNFFFHSVNSFKLVFSRKNSSNLPREGEYAFTIPTISTARTLKSVSRPSKSGGFLSSRQGIPFDDDAAHCWPAWCILLDVCCWILRRKTKTKMWCFSLILGARCLVIANWWLMVAINSRVLTIWQASQQYVRINWKIGRLIPQSWTSYHQSDNWISKALDGDTADLYWVSSHCLSHNSPICSS